MEGQGNHRRVIRAFLRLDANDLPSAQFMDIGDGLGYISEDYDPWDVLERAAGGEGTVTDLCGSAIILRADADGWRRPVKVG